MATILIADDQPQVCSAIRLLLHQQLSLGQVEEVGNLEQLLLRLSGAPAALVLLDWELPDQGGAAALAHVRTAWPRAAIVALSGRPEAREAALAAGADGFVSKGDPPERLLEAVARVARAHAAAAPHI